MFSDQFLVNYFIIFYISKKGIPLNFIISDLHELWKDNGKAWDVESSDSNTQSFETKDGDDDLVVPKENFVGKFKKVVKIATEVKLTTTNKL